MSSSPDANLHDFLETTARLLKYEDDTQSYVGRAQDKSTLQDLGISIHEAGAAEANAWRQVLDFESEWMRNVDGNRFDRAQLLAFHRLIFTTIVSGIRFGRRRAGEAYSTEEGREQLDAEFSTLGGDALEKEVVRRLGRI